MALFVVIAETDQPPLGAVIKAKFPNDHFVIDSRHWLVSATATPFTLMNDLEVNNGKFGRVMIFAIAAYNGWHNKNMWEWLALKGAQG